MPLKFLEGNRMSYEAHNVETRDPVAARWIEVTAAGSATVRFRDVATLIDMAGTVVWPIALTYAGAGTKRWYAAIPGEDLTPDPAKEYEAFVSGVDQDGARFSAREPLPVFTRVSLEA